MYLFEVLQPLAPELFWILCLAFVIAFLLAFSVGANDVSNSFGTSVGSRVLTVTQACILATIFEVAGATLLGYSVCDTFRRKMYDVTLYDGAQKELMLGALACLLGSSIWNIVATFLKMPISGTHSIVGATIGFSVVLRGWSSIRWWGMLRIVASWFASPILSGLISSCIYVLISKTIIRKVDPLRYGLKALPLFYGATIFINVASIVIDGPNVFGLNTLPWYAGLFISLVCATITICCVAMIMVPRLKHDILDELVARKAPPTFAGHRPARFSPGKPPKGAGGKDDDTDDNFTGGGAASMSAAYDNVTFKPDEQAAGAQEQPPEKPRRDLAPLDAGQLATDKSAAGTMSQAALVTATVVRKPPVAPKPAGLRRQLANDEQPMDEIDLSSPAAQDKDKDKDKDKDRDVESGPKARGQVRMAPVGQAPASQRQLAPISGNFDKNFAASGNNALVTGTGERYEVAKLFSSLQILTACFASFAHGTNDVSNAVAPLIPIWNIYATGAEDITVQTQVWILAFGSIGICTGLWAWGRAVMGTIADGLTKITPSKGFSIELGAAISVLVATKLGLPISTTHCKVGSLVVVGYVSSKFLSQDNLLAQMSASQRPQLYIDDAAGQAGQAGVRQELQIEQQDGGDSGAESVDWKLFANIAITWVSTVPMAALASAGIMYLLKWLAL